MLTFWTFVFADGALISPADSGSGNSLVLFAVEDSCCGNGKPADFTCEPDVATSSWRTTGLCSSKSTTKHNDTYTIHANTIEIKRDRLSFIFLDALNFL